MSLKALKAFKGLKDIFKEIKALNKISLKKYLLCQSRYLKKHYIKIHKS